MNSLCLCIVCSVCMCIPHSFFAACARTCTSHIVLISNLHFLSKIRVCATSHTSYCIETRNRSTISRICVRIKDGIHVCYFDVCIESITFNPTHLHLAHRNTVRKLLSFFSFHFCPRSPQTLFFIENSTHTHLDWVARTRIGSKYARLQMMFSIEKFSNENETRTI